ncbi:Ficolin-2 [Bulinus truncatus]|nr:Ficolin-2 [Bulinus truncatus]
MTVSDFTQRVTGCQYLCDTKSDGGGWIVFQRRVDRDLSFSRNWTEYKEGFGSLCGDHWLGNDNIHEITKQGRYELRIDMEYKTRRYYVQYTDFYIENEAQKYKLHFKNFKGDTTDGLKFHNDQTFATQQMDSDPRTALLCPHRFTTGWWYNICHQSNLNGQFNSTQAGVEGVYWEGLTAGHDSLTSVEMKMRKM